MKKILTLATKLPVTALFSNIPIFSASVVFLAVGVPINHFFLKDKPDNLLEQTEELVIKSVTGVNIDLSDDSDR